MTFKVKVSFHMCRIHESDHYPQFELNLTFLYTSPDIKNERTAVGTTRKAH